MNDTPNVSAVIISKNEEHNIKRCLESLKWADEIVIYDTGSTDRTLDICAEYGCAIYKCDKWEGFGKAKHQAVLLAKNDWIFSIDADEEVSEELRSVLSVEGGVIKTHHSTLQTPPSQIAYRIKRISFYMGKQVKYSGWQRDFPLRLFNRKNGNFNHKVVHEGVEVDCEVKTLSSHLNQTPTPEHRKQKTAPPVLYHYTYPQIKTHLSKMLLYSELGAKQAYEKGKKSSIYKAFFSGVGKFLKMYLLNLGFLDGKVGLVLALNSAFGVYMKHIYLWELMKRDKG